MGTSATVEKNGKAAVGGFAEYKLAGSIPSALVGKLIKTPEAATLDEMHLLVQDGEPASVLKLAQAQFDIIIQRRLRDTATSDEVADILAGKVVEIDGEKQDFSGLSEEERGQYVVDVIQGVADDFRYGSRPALTTGKTKQAKEALEQQGKLLSAAAADPELAAKLAALGYKL